MKTALVWAGRILALLSLIGLVAGWAVERDMTARSGVYQLVKASSAGALFGDAYEKIGSPQTYVVLDKSAVIAADEENPARLNEDVLKAKQVPPLQLKTVTFLVGISRLVSGGALIVGLLMALLPLRKKTAS